MIINRFSFLTKLTILISILIFINSCGMLRSADSRKIPVNAKERVKKNIEEGRGIRLFNKDDKGGTFQFASANPLWRASLETLDFIPLTNASYSGGIIINFYLMKLDLMQSTYKFIKKIAPHLKIVQLWNQKVN